jgi:nicotinate dehydrogenase subunit A
MNGQSARSCMVTVSMAKGADITTLDGLGTREKPHPVQRAFIEEQAAQCGYCLNGMVMEATAFLSHNPSPSEDHIKNALARNLCRCGAHVEIVKAVKRAATWRG